MSVKQHSFEPRAESTSRRHPVDECPGVNRHHMLAPARVCWRYPRRLAWVGLALAHVYCAVFVLRAYWCELAYRRFDPTEGYGGWRVEDSATDQRNATVDIPHPAWQAPLLRLPRSMRWVGPQLRTTIQRRVSHMMRFGVRACAVAGAACFLDGGSLVAAWREGGEVFRWDEDGDFGVLGYSGVRRLREAYDGGRMDHMLGPGAEFAGLSLKFLFPRAPGSLPIDIVARIVDSETHLYVDFFLYFVELAADPAHCPEGAAPNAPPARRQPEVEGFADDCPGFIKAKGTRHDCHCKMAAFREAYADDTAPWTAEDAAEAGDPAGELRVAHQSSFGASAGQHVVHSTWSRAWIKCRSCDRGMGARHAGRRMLTIPLAWIFPFSNCTIAGVETHCPQRTELFLHYQHGPDLRRPWAQRGHVKVAAHVLALVSGWVVAVLGMRAVAMRRAKANRGV